jgi:hypothetical protein
VAHVSHLSFFDGNVLGRFIEERDFFYEHRITWQEIDEENVRD